MPSKVRIALVDDHPLLRQGIAAVIEADKSFIICGQTDDAKMVIDLIEKTNPHVLILDISLKGINGIEVLKNIRAQVSKLPVLIFSMHDENIFAPRALKAGAMGYLNKTEGAEKILLAVRKILSGEIYLSDVMRGRLLSEFTIGNSTVSPIDSLTDRELEVLQLLGNGNTTNTIAAKLGLSVKTVETYRAHLKEKLSLKNSSELMHYAVQWASRSE
jgi:DNA-binding NarL/FixJ family response regulator